MIYLIQLDTYKYTYKVLKHNSIIFIEFNHPYNFFIIINIFNLLIQLSNTSETLITVIINQFAILNRAYE